MTKETELAFVIIYHEYKRRRSFGTAKYEAIQFEDDKLKAIDAFSDWNPGDIRYCLQELRKMGYIKMDILGDVTLQESGIEYMENKPKEYFDGFSGKILNLLSVLGPFFSAV